ncbi:MAG: AsmA family protein [Gammaproteobacteria bacterium]|nr:AsmA family protein [Gammaproteobacteria bacterium]
MTEGAASRRSRTSLIGRWLSRLVLGLLLIVGSTLVAVFSFEQYSLQPLTEFLVERATGRTLSIDGGLDVRAGRIISVRADGIRLANAEWGSGDDMLSIDETEISIDLRDLLGGTVAADNLVANNVRLLFEEDEKGRSNWAMGSGDDQPPSTTESSGPTVLPIIHSQLSNIDIMVKSAALPRPLEVHLDSLGHSVKQGNKIQATVVGAVENRPFKLQASIGSIAQLMNAGAVDIDFKADFEAISIKADGHLDKLLEPRQVNVNVSLASAEISQILATFGFPEMISGAAELEASLQPADDHHRLVLAASVDSLKLDAEARLRALDTIDGASITVAAEGPDLATTARLAGLEGLPSQPFYLESRAALSGKQLSIGETVIHSGESHLSAKGSMSQFPQLIGTNLQLQLVGKNYLEYAELLGVSVTPELKPEPFELNADMESSVQGELQFKARGKLADVGGEFSGKLEGFPSFAGSHLDYRLDGQGGGLIQQLLGQPTVIEGAYLLQGDLKRTRTGFSMERAALSTGANELEISGAIGEDPLRGDTDLSMQFHGPDLDKIIAIAGYTGFIPAGSAEINVAARTQDDGIHVDQLTAQLGRNKLKTSGLISLQAGLAGSRLKVALSGEDIAEALPPDFLTYVDAQQSFDLSGTLAIDNGQLVISVLQARLGEVTVETSGSVSTTQPLTGLSLRVDAQGPDLATIIPENLLPYSLPAEKFSVSGGVALTASGLQLDAVNAEIGLDRLGLSGTIPLLTAGDGLSLVVTASGPDLGAIVPVKFDQIDFAEQAYEIGGKIQLTQGIMSLQQLDFSTPQGQLSGQLSVSLENPVQFGEFDIEAAGDNLAEFAPSTPDYTPAAVPFALRAHGSWDSESLSIEKGTLKLDDARIEAQGKINLPPNVAATRLVLSARGDDLAVLGRFNEFNLPPDGFHIDANLQGNANSIQIPQLDLRIGESDLRGSLQIDFAGKPGIKTRLDSNLLDLVKLLSAEDGAAETEASPQPGASDGRIIPQTPIPADLLHSVNMETRIRIAELRMLHHTLHDIEFDSRLQDGKLAVNQLKATAKQGQIAAQFRAAAEGDRIITSGRLEGKDFSLGTAEATGGEVEFPKQDLILEFDTEGATVRELAANLDGYAQLTGDTGRLRNSYALGFFGSFYSELFSAINPVATREPYTNITCFAAYGEIEDGVGKINPGAVMQTDKLDMFAIGQVDLNTEQISLRFDTSARKGIGISVADFVNPFVGVSGTLASPKLGINPENAMFEGGVAYATGGLSIVAKSLYNRWFGSRDSCTQFENEAAAFLLERQNTKEKEIPEPEKSTTEGG